MESVLDKAGLTYLWEKITGRFATIADVEDSEQVIASALNDLEERKLDADTTYAGSNTVGGAANKAISIPTGQVDATSTSTVFTATVDGITELRDGVCVQLYNPVVASASGYTININGLGAKPVYNSKTDAASNTGFVKNSSYLFIYDSSKIDGGCWVVYCGYYETNSDSTGVYIRTNSGTLYVSDKFYRYRLLFTSADGSQWVPANTSTSTSATTIRNVNQRPINPFGPIIVYYTTSNFAAGSSGPVTTGFQQRAVNLGYSFNRTGGALTLTTYKPVYVKCAPQADGSAVIDADEPYVQDLPTTEDGKIYILLGFAYSTTSIELRLEHPVYYYKNGGIRLWTGQYESTQSSYAVCSTAAETVAKEVNIANYKLNVGNTLNIKFTYNVPANATLNITNTGAINIMYKGVAIVNNVIRAGDIATFVYDGTNYNLINIDASIDLLIALRDEDVVVV